MLKKSPLIILFFLCISFFANAQSIGDYRSNVASGNWNAVGSWQTWNGTAWVAPGAVPNSSNGVITIQSGHTITQNLASLSIDQLVVNGTLNTTASTTIAQGAGIDLQINSGGSFTNGSTLTLNGEVLNSGTFTVNSTATNVAAGTVTNNTSATITINASKTFTNNGKIVNSGTINNSGTLSMTSGSLYQHNFSSLAAAQGTIPNATWNANSTCEILACGNIAPPNGMLQNFGNFIWNNSTQPSTINFAGNPNTVNGDFEIKNSNGFDVIFIEDAGSSLSVGDTFKLTANTNFYMLKGISSSAVTLNTKNYYQTNGMFDMTASSGIASNCYMYVQANFSHIGGSFVKSGVSSNSSVSINGSFGSSIESTGFAITAPSINFSIACAGVGGVCTLNTSKTFVLNSNVVFSVVDNTSVTNDFIINGTFTTNTNNWNFSSGITQVNGRFKNQSTLAGTSTAAAFQFGSGAVFEQNANGGYIATASWNSNSTVEVTGIVSATTLLGGDQNFGKIVWNSIAQTSSVDFGTSGFGTQSDYTVSSTGTGVLRFPDVDFTIGGDLIVQNNATLQLSNAFNLTGTRTVTVNGNVNVLNSSLFTVGNPATASIGATNREKIYYLDVKKDFTHTSSVPMISSITKSFTANGSDRYYLVLRIVGGINQYVTHTSQVANLITFSGDGVFNSGTDDEYRTTNFYEIVVNSNSTLIAQSNLKYARMTVAVGSILDLSVGSSYNALQYQTLTNAGVTSNPATDISGTIIMGLGVLSDASGTGTFSLNANAEIRTMHAQGISTLASTGCIQNTGTRTFNAVGTKYVYNGNAAQVTGNAIPTSITGAGAFIEINNSTALTSGGVSMSKAVALTQGVLKLTAGRLISTSTFYPTLGNTASVSPAGGSASSFVHGPIKKIGYTSGVEFIFPTGKTDKWARISLTPSATSATAAFTAEYFNTAYSFLTPLDVSLDHVSAMEYWDLARTVVGTDGKVKLYWENAATSGITSAAAADLRVAHWYNPGAGLKWYAEGTSPVITVSGITGTIQTDINVTSFSPFTFGAPNGINPLPIELINFKGFAAKSSNVLQWTTATEINNDYFQLERSTNGYEFTSIATIDGAGNSTSIKNYEFTDENASEKIYYYRLKQVDFDGRFSYSNIISIERNQASNSFIDVYPNPSNTGIINISTSDDVTEITIYNAVGQVVRKINTAATSNYIQDINIAEGVYIVKALLDDNSILTTRIIVSK